MKILCKNLSLDQKFEILESFFLLPKGRMGIRVSEGTQTTTSQRSDGVPLLTPTCEMEERPTFDIMKVELL